MFTFLTINKKILYDAAGEGQEFPITDVFLLMAIETFAEKCQDVHY